MLQDIFSIPNSETVDIQIFGAGGFTTSPKWQNWVRPRGKTMAYISCIGAGGGGGAGLTGAAGSARGGGGGGASSCMSSLLIPLIFLPNQLYLHIYSGGLGGASSGNAGAVGNHSYISINQSETSPSVLLCSGVIGASNGAGTAGTAAGSNTGGTAGSAPTQQILAKFGIQGSFAGMSGGNSGAIAGASGAAGVTVNLWGGNVPLAGGSGGGTVGTNNTDFAGGTITVGPSGFYTQGGGAAGGGAGIGGAKVYPYVLYPGLGGGTAGAAGTGGKGGDATGAPGCGGGGGGGGVTGGAGGNGGDGQVMIICW